MINLPSAEFWVERDDTTIHEYVWRDSEGNDYIDENPADTDDVKVGRRDSVVVRGTLVGSFPELGDLIADGDGGIITLANRTYLHPLVYFED